MTWFILLILGTTVVLNILVFILIATQDLRSGSSRAFLASNICVILWTIGTGLVLTTTTEQLASFGVQLFYVAPMALVVFFVLFAANFLSQSRRIVFGRGIITLAILTLLFAGVILLYPRLLTSSIEIVPFKENILHPTNWYALYAFYFLLGFPLGFYYLLRRMKKARGRYASQVRYVFFGIAAAVIVSGLTNLLLPLLGISQYLWVGPAATVFYVLAVALSIIRHGLFNIRLAVVRTLTYALSLLVMVGVYFGIAYLFSLAFFQVMTVTGFGAGIFNIVLALFLAFLFQPVKRFFDRVTDQLFFRDRYHTDEFISQLSSVLISATNLRDLLEGAAAQLNRLLGASFSTFIIYRGSDVPIQVGSSQARKLSVEDITELELTVHATDGVILVEDDIVESDLRPVMRRLIKRGVHLVVPLVRRDVRVGFLLLGEQRGGGYTGRDVHVLDTVSDELVIAIQNTLSLQEIADINAHLEQRISQATEELRESNEKLRALDETKDEFISMASHQLRTPLTSVKGYISMVLDGDAGEITSSQRKLLAEAFASSERMVHLIGDILNVSRLQTGKFIIDAKPTDLAQLVAEEVESIQSLVSSHNMKLTYTRPKNIPVLMLDEEKLRQVIMNFIDNAVYYSRPKATIVVKLYRSGSDVKFEVHDQGIGVPKSAQKMLFTKFFRAENARTQRPDGTGIGLFLAKKVITTQGGVIIFESTEGKGSVFGFSFPIRAVEPK